MEDIGEVLKLLRGKAREVEIVLAASWKYDFLREAAKQAEAGTKLREALGRAIRALPKELRAEAGRLMPKIVKDPRVLNLLVPREVEERAIREAREFLEKELGVKIVIALEEESKEPKARQALPAKPAIIVR